MTNKKFLSMFAIIFVTIMAFTSCSSKSKAIDIVKNGAFESNAGISVNQLAKDFFIKPEYSAFKDEEENWNVEISGTANWEKIKNDFSSAALDYITELYLKEYSYPDASEIDVDIEKTFITPDLLPKISKIFEDAEIVYNFEIDLDEGTFSLYATELDNKHFDYGTAPSEFFMKDYYSVLKCFMPKLYNPKKIYYIGESNAQDETGPVSRENKHVVENSVKRELEFIDLQSIGPKYSFELTDSKQYVFGSEYGKIIDVVYTYTINDAKFLAKLREQKITDRPQKIIKNDMHENIYSQLLVNNNYTKEHCYTLADLNSCMNDGVEPNQYQPRTSKYARKPYAEIAKSRPEYAELSEYAPNEFCFDVFFKKTIDSLGCDPCYFEKDDIYRTTKEDVQNYKNSLQFYSDVLEYIRTGEKARYYYNKEYAEKKWKQNKMPNDYTAWYFENGKKGTEEEYKALKKAEIPVPEDVRLYEDEIDEYKRLLTYEDEIELYKTPEVESLSYEERIKSYNRFLENYKFYFVDRLPHTSFLNQYLHDYIKFAQSHINDYEDLFRINRMIPDIIDDYKYYRGEVPNFSEEESI